MADENPNNNEQLNEIDVEGAFYVEKVESETEDLQNKVDEMSTVDYSTAIDKKEQERTQLNELTETADQTTELNEFLEVTKVNTDQLDDIQEAEEDYNDAVNRINETRDETGKIKPRTPMDVFEEKLTRSPEDYVESLNELADALGAQFENAYGESVEDALSVTNEEVADNAETTEEQPTEKGVDVSNLVDEETDTGATPTEESEEQPNVDVTVNQEPTEFVINEEKETDPEPETEVDQSTVIVQNETEVVEKDVTPESKVTEETTEVVEKDVTPESKVTEETTEVVNVENNEKVVNAPVETVEEQSEETVQVEKEEQSPILETTTPIQESSQAIEKMNSLLESLPQSISIAIESSLSGLGEMMEGTKKEIIRNTENNSVKLVDNSPTSPTEGNVKSEEISMDQLYKMFVTLDHRMRMIHTALQSPLDVKVKYD